MRTGDVFSPCAGSSALNDLVVSGLSAPGVGVLVAGASDLRVPFAALVCSVVAFVAIPPAVGRGEPGGVLFGPGSGAALATVVGALVEVPVVRSDCAFHDRTRHWFPRAAGVARPERVGLPGRGGTP